MRGFAQTQCDQNLCYGGRIWNFYPHTISRDFFSIQSWINWKCEKKYSTIFWIITIQLQLHKVFEPIMPQDWICLNLLYMVFVMEVGTHSYTLTLYSSSCMESQKKVTFIFGGRHQKKTVFRKRIAQVSGHNES